MSIYNKPLRFYFENGNGSITYLENNSGIIGIELIKEKQQSKMKFNYFQLTKGYFCNNDDLVRFQTDFLRCSDELKQYGINYCNYNEHYSAVEQTFQRFAKHDINKFQIDKVQYVEYSYIEECYNAGIMCLDAKYKDIETKSYGYDFSQFYPSFLNKTKLKLPLQVGKQIKLDELDFNKLQYGIYKVKISCDNNDFKKVFCFSKRGFYTHFSLEFANKYKDLFQVKMELDLSADYNALVYEEKFLIPTIKIFGNWFNKLKEIKEKCKKNFLAKHLISSLWGSICKKLKCYFNEDAYCMLDVCRTGNSEYTKLNEKYYCKNKTIHTYFECIETKNPYKYPYARLKPFLLSLSRNVVGETIMRNNLINNVIRIHTDGLVLNKEFDFSKQEVLSLFPIVEDKTTGNILWKNCNDYKKIE